MVNSTILGAYKFKRVDLVLSVLATINIHKYINERICQLIKPCVKACLQLLLRVTLHSSV